MFKKVILLILTLLVTMSGIAIAGTIDLPQTGQTTCYSETGVAIACTATGQDGDVKAGIAWPIPRFTNPDGTTPVTDNVVIDQLTGLMWARNAGTPTVGPCTGGIKTWQQALDFIECLNLNEYLGYNDWRLPNINELESLVHYGIFPIGPWLINKGFINVINEPGTWNPYYWSSTTVHSVGRTFEAYRISMWSGSIISGPKNENFYFYAWPMRGTTSGPTMIGNTGQITSYSFGDDGDLQMGVAWPDPRFINNFDGTVTDKLTGLMWTEDAGLPGSSVTWQQALNYVAGRLIKNFVSPCRI